MRTPEELSLTPSVGSTSKGANTAFVGRQRQAPSLTQARVETSLLACIREGVEASVGCHTEFCVTVNNRNALKLGLAWF